MLSQFVIVGKSQQAIGLFVCPAMQLQGLVQYNLDPEGITNKGCE